jgi:hypothetical protein
MFCGSNTKLGSGILGSYTFMMSRVSKTMTLMMKLLKSWSFPYSNSDSMKNMKPLESTIRIKLNS